MTNFNETLEDMRMTFLNVYDNKIMLLSDR